MRALLTLPFFLSILMSCANDDEVLLRINEKFTVYRSAACACNTLSMTDAASKEITLVKHVLVVMGNTEEFLVQTSAPGTDSPLWMLVKSTQTTSTQDIVSLNKDEVDKVLEVLKIEFVKDYSSL